MYTHTHTLKRKRDKLLKKQRIILSAPINSFKIIFTELNTHTYSEDSEETKMAEMIVPALNLVLCNSGDSYLKENAKRPEDR